MEFAGLADIGWETVSALSSIAIAFIGYLIGRSIRRRSSRVDQYSHLVEYRREIIEFSRTFSDLVSDALAVMATPALEDRNERLISICSRISGHVDLGRMYFPNDTRAQNNFGHEKGKAYAGARLPALDAMLAAHIAIKAEISDSVAYKEEKLAEGIRILERVNQPLEDRIGLGTPRAVLIQARRAYFNEVAPEVFPRKWYSEFKSLLGPVTEEGSSTEAASHLSRSHTASWANSFAMKKQ